MNKSLKFSLILLTPLAIFSAQQDPKTSTETTLFPGSKNPSNSAAAQASSSTVVTTAAAAASTSTAISSSPLSTTAEPSQLVLVDVNAPTTLPYTSPEIPEQTQVYTMGRFQGDNPYKFSTNLQLFSHIVSLIQQGKIVKALEVDPNFPDHLRKATCGAQQTLQTTTGSHIQGQKYCIDRERKENTVLFHELGLLTTTIQKFCAKNLSPDSLSSLISTVHQTTEEKKRSLELITQEYQEQMKFLQQIETTLSEIRPSQDAAATSSQQTPTQPAVVKK